MTGSITPAGVATSKAILPLIPGSKMNEARAKQ